ncbi:MAG: hypothetical protein IJQ71_03415 [Clostridia bacterium]|nr:hypothetical protein [Clostridia bacterium]
MAVNVKLGDRTIPLDYTAYEMVAIQKEIGCTSYQLKEEVFGLRLEDEDDPSSIRLDVVNDPEKVEKLGKLIAILGNAGLEAKGEKADLTSKWVLRNMKPGLILHYAVFALKEIMDGNAMETKKEETGPVDEGLEEQQAKKQQGN